MAIDTRTVNKERAKRVLDALPPWPAVALPSLHAPLSVEQNTGRVRIAGTRIAIDAVVYAYLDGLNSGEIVRSYPTLSLRDVDAVISYYHQHREAVDAYLRAWEEHGDAVRSVVEADPAHQAFRATLTERRGAIGE